MTDKVLAIDSLSHDEDICITVLRDDGDPIITVRNCLENVVTVARTDFELVAPSDALAGDTELEGDIERDEVVEREPDMVTKEEIVRELLEYADGILAVVVSVLRAVFEIEALIIVLFDHIDDTVINDKDETVGDNNALPLFVGVERADVVALGDFELAEREFVEVA